MTDGLTGDEFVGYTFGDPPERRPRLWFLDRHIRRLVLDDGPPPYRGLWGWGYWEAELPALTSLQPDGLLSLTAICLRYENRDPSWVAVWRLTDTIIEHVNTLGHDDDVWRLGIWPD